MIVAGDVLPEQLGAFLMLLRVKEESPEEIAGFVLAAREAMALPSPLPKADLDWSSYAGKRRQLPWFILAALLLARNGMRVFMHGGEGHTPGRVYTSEALARLGIPVAGSFEQAAAHLGQRNFAYMTLDQVSPALGRLINMRPILGLRSAVHTLSRMLNPFAAPAMLQAVFHPGYMNIHQGAALLLGQPHMAVFRGEGGEIEMRPNKPCEVLTVHEGAMAEERWSALLPEPRQAPEAGIGPRPAGGPMARRNHGRVRRGRDLGHACHCAQDDGPRGEPGGCADPRGEHVGAARPRLPRRGGIRGTVLGQGEPQIPIVVSPHPVPLPLGEGTPSQRLRASSLSHGERAGVRGCEANINPALTTRRSLHGGRA